MKNLRKNAATYLPDILILVSVFLFMLYVRASLNRELVFVGGEIIFQGNDPWFHFRLVENTLEHFPRRILFDPMTNFPTGSRVHMGPLFTLLIAGAALILGAGNPDPATTATVAVYVPPLLGALTVIPVYLVGKELGGRKTGILAALTLATISGEFLNRSLVGFTDHHVAESLFSILALWVYLVAIRRVQRSGITYTDIAARDWEKIKHPVTVALASGVAFCIYILMWPGAFILALAIMVSTVIICLADSSRGTGSDYLGIVGAGTFLVPAAVLLAIVPRVSLGISSYSMTQVYLLLMLAAIVITLTLFMKRLRQLEVPASYLPLGTAAFAVLGAVVAKLIVPGLYNTMLGALGYLLPSKGNSLTIQEARPLLMNNHLDYAYIESSFGYVFYISILALVFLVIRSLTQQRRSDIIFLVWGVEVLMLTLSQMRFTYYYAISGALLTGFLFGLGLEMTGFDRAVKNWHTLRKYCSPLAIIKKRLRPAQLAVVVVFVLLVLYPAASNPSFTTVFQTGDRGAQHWYHSTMDDWYDSLRWMRYNTPDPGVDYYGMYSYPEGGRYPYPDSAYGVMSWWDYGHYITYFAHRIPNANPFQQGATEAARFFTARDQDSAQQVLDAAGTRYVITEYAMVGPLFDAMTVWADDDTRYSVTVDTPRGPRKQYTLDFFRTMVVRLHVLDGSRTRFQSDVVVAGLERFRLVHESPTTTENFGGQEVKRVKIFEYVPGAGIVGSADPGSVVSLSLQVRTNQGRTFSYRRTTAADESGQYSFTVPYATRGQAAYDTFAVSDYQIQWGTTSLSVPVTEEDVMAGNIIQAQVFSIG